MEYLYDDWGAFKARLRDKQIFLFLDFDGTLSEIADSPDKAVLDIRTKELLRKLALKPGMRLAVISGRSLEDIKGKVGLKNIIYSGNHGLEIEGPKITFKPQVSLGFRKDIEQIKQALSEKVRRFPGVLLEDKGLTLSFHFRKAKGKDTALLKTIFHETVIMYIAKGKVMVKEGKKVLEVRPPTDWDKGKVVLWLLARQRVFKGNDVAAVYIGDDVTDEDAFRALRRKGVSIRVGRSVQSEARYYLNDCDEVRGFLEKLTEV